MDSAAKRNRGILFIGSHMGYPMDRTPLGGGAMVGVQLARQWARDGNFRLKALGSGPLSPGPGVDYESLGAPREKGLVSLSELGYARFCRRFEHASLSWIEAHKKEWPPERTCIVLNDISESPDAARLAAMGYPILSIWHVDVVDFFNKMYFRDWIGAQGWTRAYEGVRRLRLSWAVPDVFHLVLEKQRRIVLHSGKLAVPSKRMAATIEACYRRADMKADGAAPPLSRRIDVVPWGCWPEETPESEVLQESARLKRHYQLGPNSRVLMTLSRISPEKGISVLLDALRLVESSSHRPSGDLCLFICGEPAFMRGESYYRRVRASAERLKTVRVFFPGYLEPKAKRAYFGLADVFVSPSLHESYGLTIVEAMQAGLPVLASDHSGAEETLFPEFSRIVPYGGAGRVETARRMAGALRELLADPNVFKEMGRRARAAAERTPFAGAAQKIADDALALRPMALR